MHSRHLIIPLAACIILAGHATHAAGTEHVTTAGVRSSTADQAATRARYQTWLAAHNFDELERTGKGFLANYHAKEISADKLTEELMLMVSGTPKAFLPDVEAWVRERPHSYTAHLVLGVEYLMAAQNARGTRWARDTSEAQFAEMRDYLKKAHAALSKSLALEQKPYPSYRSLVTVNGLRSDKTGMTYALNGAVRTDPDAVGAYIRYIDYGSPRWGGSYEDLDRVMAAARKTSISRDKLGMLEAAVLSWKARDESGIHKRPAQAADYWEAAYHAHPGLEQVEYLYSAAKEARAAKQMDRAIGIYTQIVTGFNTQDNAFFQRGTIYHEEKQDFKRALEDFLSAARLGNKFAQNNVGFYYMTGKAGSTDLALARTYLQMAADQGYEHAREKLKLLDKQQ